MRFFACKNIVFCHLYIFSRHGRGFWVVSDYETLIIRIELPVDRDYVGALRVLSKSGEALAGPFRIAARASDEIAAAHGNPTRATTLPYGDPPLGSYRYHGMASTGEGTKYRRDLFGPLDVIVLTGSSGHAALADANGRFEIMIHGGPLAAGGGLRAGTGHFRISDPDLTAVSDLIRRARTAFCVCEEAQLYDRDDLVSDLSRLTDRADEPRLTSYRRQRVPVGDEFLVAWGEYAPDGGAAGDAGSAPPGGVATTSLNSPTLPPAGQQGSACMGMETICQNMQYGAAQSQTSNVEAYTGTQYTTSPLLANPFSGGPSAFFPNGQPVNAYNGGQGSGGGAGSGYAGSPTGSGRTGSPTGSSATGSPTGSSATGSPTGSSATGSPTGSSAATNASSTPYNAGQPQSLGNFGFSRQDSATIPFYQPPQRGDIIGLISHHDTGNTYLNYSVNWIYGYENLFRSMVNLPGEVIADPRGFAGELLNEFGGLLGAVGQVLSLPQQALRAIGLGEGDIQAFNYSLWELGASVNASRAAALALEDAAGSMMISSSEATWNITTAGGQPTLDLSKSAYVSSLGYDPSSALETLPTLADLPERVGTTTTAIGQDWKLYPSGVDNLAGELYRTATENDIPLLPNKWADNLPNVGGGVEGSWAATHAEFKAFLNNAFVAVNYDPCIGCQTGIGAMATQFETNFTLVAPNAVYQFFSTGETFVSPFVGIPAPLGAPAPYYLFFPYAKPITSSGLPLPMAPNWLGVDFRWE
jgi:hypothetical protein